MTFCSTADTAGAVEVAGRREQEARAALDEAKRVESDLAKKLDVKNPRFLAAGSRLEQGVAAEFTDFYRPGDGKVIFVKDFGPAA